MRRGVRILLAMLGIACGLPVARASAQVDSTVARQRADSARRADSLARRQPPPVALKRIVRRTDAPITARRAFLLSLVLPGLGQSRLDRGGSGALFASVEISALAMVRRTLLDVQEARRFTLDSLPESFAVQPDGTVRPVGVVQPRFSEGTVRLRRLQVEDWLAVVAFNHLISAADAFVSAQLWDVPLDVGAAPLPRGAVVSASIRW
jgi:hypothetical protein